jgi:hypothetical protein
MSIPVIMLVPMSAATAGFEGSGGLPTGLQLDANFPLIPFGSSGAPSPVAGVDAESSGEPLVAVRGFVEASIEDPPQMLDGYVVYNDPEIAPFLTCGGDAPVGTAQDVAAALNVSELLRRGLDGSRVAVAVLDSGINLTHLSSVIGFTPNFDAANSWTPPGSAFTPGDFPVGHGTMCAYDVLIAAPSATLVDMPVLSAGTTISGSMMAGYLSSALLAFANMYASWNSGVGSGDLSQYDALVCTSSWGIFHPSWDFPPGHPGRYCDNPNHPFILLLETLSRGGMDILFAAGNCGADCPDGRCQNRTTETIMGASASVDVMSIAACDINGERVGYSSQGPSITNMYGMKPDITAYSHFLGSEAFGAGTADSGTSAACPVTAGCMAALRSRISPRTPATPYMMYSHFREQATTPAGQSTGWNSDYGYGIINAVGIADQFGL